MPVYKYKTFEDAEKALWNFKPDEKYFKRIEGLFQLAGGISAVKYPKGIFKFKTIEKANRHREKIELEHAVNLRLRRQAEK